MGSGTDLELFVADADPSCGTDPLDDDTDDDGLLDGDVVDEYGTSEALPNSMKMFSENYDFVSTFVTIFSILRRIV